MRNSARFFIGFSLLVLIASYSCSENSEAEMKAAQQAMDNAKSFHAEDLATSDFKEAMVSWERGQNALKEGKPAKTYFLRAKSRFEKTATIAKAQLETVSKDITNMQMTIGERLAKVKIALEAGRLSSRIQNQIKPILEEVEAGTASINHLVDQGDYLKARATAKEIQTKVYNAELIMAGKKPEPAP
jgi:hypothetical protein